MYIGKDFGKAIRKREKLIGEAPDLKLVDNRFSEKVQSMKGPILEKELAKFEKFGNKIVECIE